MNFQAFVLMFNPLTSSISSCHACTFRPGTKALTTAATHLLLCSCEPSTMVVARVTNNNNSNHFNKHHHHPSSSSSSGPVRTSRRKRSAVWGEERMGPLRVTTMVSPALCATIRPFKSDTTISRQTNKGIIGQACGDYVRMVSPQQTRRDESNFSSASVEGPYSVLPTSARRPLPTSSCESRIPASGLFRCQHISAAFPKTPHSYLPKIP